MVRHMDDRVIATVDRPEKRRFEMTVDGRLAGVATYELEGDQITLVHTRVARPFEGRGLGSRLAKSVLDDVRARGVPVRVECPFLTRYIRTHPAYRDFLAR
jgi:uncharacterized protein